MKDFYQEKNISYIEERYGTEEFVQVCGRRKLNDADASFWCGLVKSEHIQEIFKSVGWDTHYSDCYPGFVECGDKVSYTRYLRLNEYIEPIIFGREFYGLKEDYVEVSEEFRLLNNLYYNKYDGNYYYILENGEMEEVIKIQDKDTILISLKYLKKYASAKKMTIVLFFDIRYEVQGTLKDNKLDRLNRECKTDEIFYTIGCKELGTVNKTCISRLLGKKILYSMPIEKCGYYPYESQRKYIDYIIGIDENGENIEYTSNPDKLADYFGKNSDAPHYLTPVTFKSEVLDKYIKRSEYKVTDGRISCGYLWGIKIDNDHKGYISAYLGDLGTYLPESEQLHWKYYNIVCAESLSKTAFCRDFLNCPVESAIIDLKFKRDYKLLQQKWYAKYGWEFFKKLTEEDKHNFDNIHVPYVESQSEFDNLVQYLVKSIIDSINEECLSVIESTNDKGEKIRGITKLEEWFSENKYQDYEKHIQFLRNVQALRSSCSSHRKGKNYEKISKKFEMGEHSLIDTFESILYLADEFICYLLSLIDN